MSSRVCKDSTT